MFSRSAGTYDGENFANVHLDADFVHKNLFPNHPRQVLAFESRPLRRRTVELISIFQVANLLEVFNHVELQSCTIQILLA